MKSLTEAQLACLATPMRAELYVCLKMNGSLSINEVSTKVGSSSESLYHHFRKLQAIGLVEVVEVRPAGTRKEAVFRVSDPDLSISQTDGGAGYAAKRADLVGATMRKAERDYRAATLSSATNPNLADYLFGGRVNSRLTLESMALLREKLSDLSEWLIAHDDPSSGTRVSFNTVVTPVGRREA